MSYCTVQYSTVQNSAVQYRTEQPRENHRLKRQTDRQGDILVDVARQSHPYDVIDVRKYALAVLHMSASISGDTVRPGLVSTEGPPRAPCPPTFSVGHLGAARDAFSIASVGGPPWVVRPPPDGVGRRGRGDHRQKQERRRRGRHRAN